MSDEEAKRGYAEILQGEIRTAVTELRRPPRGLIWSGLSAGLDIGFSALAVGVALAISQDLSSTARELMLANAYTIGFIAVIFGRSELFTEHTTLALLPVLDGKGTLRQLLRTWGLIYAANLAGTAVFAALLATLGPALGTVPRAALGEMAARLADHPAWVILLSAVLAGWMMGLVSWLVTAGRDTTGQILFTWLITGLIGFAHLHHSIVGSVEMFAGWFAGAGVGGLDYLRVIGLSTLGNAVGGGVFVAVVKYAHASVEAGPATPP